MTNEEKKVRISELNYQKGLINNEIMELEAELNDQLREDYTGRLYTSGGSYLKVIDGKDDRCLVLEVYIQENMFNGDLVPKNNEFTMRVEVYHMRKYLIEQWIQIDMQDEDYGDDCARITHYIKEHFSNYM